MWNTRADRSGVVTGALPGSCLQPHTVPALSHGWHHDAHRINMPSNSATRPTRPSRPPQGFTLIEMLVVIVIIGVLMGIIFPVINSARQISRVARCATNLRAIGQAWQMYLDDYRGYFPPYVLQMWWQYGGVEPAEFNAIGPGPPIRPLNPYVGASLEDASANVTEVFRCPSDRPIHHWDESLGEGVTRGRTAFQYFGNAYMLNPLLLYKDDPDQPGPQFYRMAVHFVQIDHSSLVLAGDCQWYYSVNDRRWDANFHNGDDRMNLLFLDGHVRFTQITRGEAWTDDYNFIPRPGDLPREDRGQSTGN